MSNKKISSAGLAGLVAEGMMEKKGYDIVQLDMRGIHNSVTDFFVICHATSAPQAEALADSVEEVVKNTTGLNPVHSEGRQHSEWILIDYFDVVAHIFIEAARDFYKLESLWADAEVKKIHEKNKGDGR